MIDEIAFDERGLAPCVIQDAGTGEVLTLAWVNAESLERTIETGEMHLWSRSRDELWHKGATSGNVQRVRELRYDCDADAVLALVDAAGPACHTGERTCFYRASTARPARSRTRRCRSSSGRSPPAATSDRRAHTPPAARRSRADRRQGPRGGRRGRSGGSRRVRRARRRGVRRPPLPPGGRAGVARPRHRGGLRRPQRAPRRRRLTALSRRGRHSSEPVSSPPRATSCRSSNRSSGTPRPRSRPS